MSTRPKNYLLQSLSPDDFEILRRDLEPQTLSQGASLYEPEDVVDAVYFLESGLVSIISIMTCGATAETSIVGRNGGVGFVEACGSEQIHSRVVVQAPGLAWVAPASRYRTAYDDSASLRRTIHTSIELQLAEARQTIACNSLHSAEERLSRWLLFCQEDGGHGDVIPTTQEFLAAMLGLQRTTVTQIAGHLEARGLIRQWRGKVEILDKAGLENQACECRRAICALRGQIQPGAT